jgi:hypothetical protein
MKYTKKPDEMHKYLEDKLKENNNSTNHSTNQSTNDIKESSVKHVGGNKNVDYRHKYKKYKKMYAELLEKYKLEKS